jgi:hypothetical protein
VAWGLGATLGSDAVERESAFDHALRIGGLSPETAHRFRVTAEDAAGNRTTSATLTFRTTAPGPAAFVVDDDGDGFSRGGSWAAGGSPGGNDGDYLYSSARSEETAWAEFRPYLPLDGRYAVAAWYVSGSNRVADAEFVVRHRDGPTAAEVDQRSGGGSWQRLGTFRFAAGSAGFVRLSNRSAGSGVVVADAARFALVEADPTFIRGDANSDGVADISDAVAILGYLFLGTAAPPCLDAADSNDSGDVDLSDASSLLNHLFLGAPPPPAPYPWPGTDPTPDALSGC